MSKLPLTRRQFTVGSLAATALSTSGVKIASAATKLAPVKIGVILPASGLHAQVGIACKRAIDIAAGFLGDLGLSAEILFADAESSVDVGRAKAEKLIGEGAQVIIGAYNSGITAAIAQVCEQKEVPFVINIAAAPQITEQGYKYVFRNFMTGEQLTRQGLELMKDLFKTIPAGQQVPKTAVLMHVNDTYGQAMRKGIDKLFPTLDMPFEIVDTISYDPKATSLSTEVRRLKSKKPDLVLPVTRLNDAILMVKEFVKQRFEPLAVISPGSPGMYEKQFYSVLGKYSEYLITNTAWFNPQSNLTKQAKEIFYKKFPEEQFDMNVAFTLEAIYIAAEAYKRAGTGNSQELRKALSETNVKERIILGGPIAFDEKGQAKDIRSASLQNLQRKPQVILPVSCKEADCAVYPMPSWRAKERV